MNRNIKLGVKKTEIWLHRIVGKKSLKLPYYQKDKIKRLRICGSSAYSSLNFIETDSVNSGIDPHRLRLTLGTRNLLDYSLVFPAIKANVPALRALLSGIRISLVVKKTEFLAPVIDSSMVEFKENTVYTFVGTVSFGANDRGDLSSGFCFIYTDGTVEDISVYCPGPQQVKIRAESAPGKTISSIGMQGLTPTNQFYYITTHFGIYEGTYPESDSLSDEFVAPEEAIIPLDAPLRGIDGACDILDLTEGIYQRNVEYLLYDSASSFDATEEEHIFITRLPTKVRDDASFYCPFWFRGASSASDSTEWVQICEDRQSFLLHAPDCLTKDELDAKLRTAPFGVVYAMDRPIEKSISNISFKDTSDKKYLSVDSVCDPHLFHIDYV